MALTASRPHGSSPSRRRHWCSFISTPRSSESPSRRVVERRQDDRSFVDLEAEQLDLVAQSLLEPLGELDPRRPS
jgi:hypothetical protein